MGVWKNFKDTDHSVEKSIFRALLAVVICVCLFFLIDNASHAIPDVRELFVNNGKYFRWFLFSAAGLSVFSYMTYTASLDFWEAETKATVRVSMASALLWAMLWFCWAAYCAWLTITNTPLTKPVKWTIIFLVIVPSFFAFVVSHRVRHQQLKQNAIDATETEPYTICVDKKYYSGYYGLLCLPIYLLCLLAHKLL